MALKISKKVMAIIVSVVLVLVGGGIALLIGLSATPRDMVLKIYNWEDYIEESLVKKFEKEYRALPGNERFKVEYHTFTDNEELYTKIKTQKADYDIAFPSEYMVEKLRDEKTNLLQEIDLNLIPNHTGLDEEVLTRTSAFSQIDGKTDKVWSIPYIYGTLGIMYDTTVIGEMAANTNITVENFEDLLNQHGWGVLFGDGGTTQYKNKITMKKSARDTIGIAMLYSQLSSDNYLDNIQKILNMSDEYKLSMAEKVLNEQIENMKPTYENDSGKQAFADPNDKRFAYGLYWSCDAGLIMQDNTNIKFFVPKGTNLWTDNIIMPKYGKNSAAAHAFINFMLDAENATANMDYLGSAMPVTEAINAIRGDKYEEGTDNYLDTVFPTSEAIEYSAVMRNFSAEQENSVNDLMVSVLNRSAMLNEDEGNSSWVYILFAVLLIAFVAYLIFYYTRRNRRRRI